MIVAKGNERVLTIIQILTRETSANDTMVKIPFQLQERWFPLNAVSQSVEFEIDKNVTGFSFCISWETRGYIVFVEGVTRIY